MKVNIREEWAEEVEKLLTKEEIAQLGRWRWKPTRGVVKLDISVLGDESLGKVEIYLGKHADQGTRSAKLSRTAVRRWKAIKECPDGTHKVLKLENLEPVLGEIIKASEKGFVFEYQPDENLVPWFVHEIAYKAANGRGHYRTPACVELTLMAENAGGKSVRKLVASDLHRRSLSQVLEAKGLVLETTAHMTRCQAELRAFRQFEESTGKQVNVRGAANLINGWRDTGFRDVEKAGIPARMVIDIEPPSKPKPHRVYHDDEDEPVKGPVHAPYWSKDEDTLWEIPVHPILHVFDLEEHALYRAHVNQVQPYEYNTKVEQSLVLPSEQKDFIRLLIGHSKDTFQDIVKGKEGGTIVMLGGPPGVGKTLTAEVYAEVMERPLYRVHSSQIGVNPETIEKTLKEVLTRAERWGAILLIDEGDVFLHERGNDIVQNAIVGVFLRLLEYYRGVLFTTTNRGTSIDDAIISRLTARFEYQMPSTGEQKELWQILGAQNGIDIPADHIDEIVHRLPNLSGRDIKNLLKLAIVASAPAGAITPDLLVRVSRFRQTRGTNRVELAEQHESQVSVDRQDEPAHVAGSGKHDSQETCTKDAA